MLNEEQQTAEVSVTGGEVVIALQVISRLVSSGGLKDVELSPVGTARDALVAALEAATGVNFDAAKAQQEAMQRQRLAQAREAHAQAQAEAAATAEAPAEDETKAEAPSGNTHAADIAADAEAE